MNDPRPARRLRVGVALDGVRVPGWVSSVLQFLDAEPDIDWVVAFVTPGSGEGRRSALLRVYEVFDRRWYGEAATGTLDLSDVRGVLEGRLVLDGHALVTGEDAPKIDVLVDLCEAPAAMSSMRPDNERWWLSLADAAGSPVDAALVSAFAARSPVCEVTVLSQRGTTRSGLSSVVALNLTSLVVSRSVVYQRAALLFTRRMRARVHGVEIGDDDARTSLSEQPATDVMMRATRSAWLAGFAARRLAGVARSKVDKLVRAREQWIIGIRERVPDRSFTDPQGYIPVVPPTDRMYADPFLVDRGEGTLVFLEEMAFATGKGVISVAELRPNGELSEPRVVLERPYHLSFPFVFREGPAWFMIPETASSGTIELYRSLEFPHRWELERTLLNGVTARDSTLLRVRGLYWLFTTVEACGAGRYDELHVFHSDELAGPWIPHSGNPVVSDVRCARGAGQIFEHEGELIRPAQDCSDRYGGATVFRRILELDEHTYREETIGVLAPTWTSGLHGAHTYNRSESFEVVDGARIVRTSKRSGRR